VSNTKKPWTKPQVRTLTPEEVAALPARVKQALQVQGDQSTRNAA
jgi:hypothetical protein